MEAPQYGLTPPISTQLPSEAEMRQNDALIEALTNQGTFESPEETQRRHHVLSSLQKVTDAFVKKIATEREPNNPVLIRDAHGKIFTYGSFRLGVYGPGSDIDTLVVVPRYVTREDYFHCFPDLLKAMAPEGAIAEMTVVTDAFVPIIKFEYSGISIDLIFSRIATLKQLPRDDQWDLKDNGLLRGLDEPELRSLNGTRVTDEILGLVPEQGTFRLALRAIKHWAQRRAIYANIMGFPGGVAWAMLVARVCQLYPRATSSTLVNKFFHIMRRWPWPQPVLLKHVEDGPLQVRVWNPRVYKGDQYHLMPVITPAYPSMCSTYNITRSAMTIIRDELERGTQITDMILMGRKPWADLFTKHTFFTDGFKYYIAVNAVSKTKEAHKVWSGFVESKVRVLVQGLERHPSISLARPFNKGYDRVHLCKNNAEIEQVQNGHLGFLVPKTPIAPVSTPAAVVEANGAGENKDSKQPADSSASDQNDTTSSPANGTQTPNKTNGQPKTTETELEGTTLFTTTHYIGLTLADGAKSLDLSYQVNEFRDLCASWNKFQPHLNSLGIQHVRSHLLPDDIFDANEVKPTRPTKKKRTATEDAGNPAKRQQQPQTSLAAAAAG